jgi:hypothetical protein
VIKATTFITFSSPFDDGISRLQHSLITFEYGPPELNLFKYIAEESSFLWRKTNEIYTLNKDGEPSDGLLLVHEDSENAQEVCLRLFEFVPQTTSSNKCKQIKVVYVRMLSEMYHAIATFFQVQNTPLTD